MADILGMADEAGPDDHWEPRPPRPWQLPAPLAIFSLALAIMCLEGTQYLRGSTYTNYFVTSRIYSVDGEGGPSTGWITVGAFLSAAFALVPLLAAWRGSRRVTEEDPAWVGTALRGALLLSVLGLALRLAAAVIIATSADGSAGLQLGFYS
jgi:hypothetical protein